MTDSPQPPPPPTLDAFEAFMRPGQKEHDWVLVERKKDLLRYEETIPAANGSCFLAGILLILGLIPGILYVVFARHPAATHRLTVALQPDGTLSPSGDHEGLRVFKQFIDPVGFNRALTQRRVVVAVVIVIAVIALFWLGSR